MGCLGATGRLGLGDCLGICLLGIFISFNHNGHVLYAEHHLLSYLNAIPY